MDMSGHGRRRSGWASWAAPSPATSAGAGWRVIGFDTERRDAPRLTAGAASRSPSGGRGAGAALPPSHHHEPARPQAALGDRSGDRRRRRAAAGGDREPARSRSRTSSRSEASLRKAGHVALDCPVSGTGRAGAGSRIIVVYASGDSEDDRQASPAVRRASRARSHDLGAYGNGSRMKYVANLLVAIHNVASAEAMVLGMKAGLDPKTDRRARHAPGPAPRACSSCARPDDGEERLRATPTMKISTWQKDMAVIGDYRGQGSDARRRCSAPPCRSTPPPCRTATPRTTRAAVCAVLEAHGGRNAKRQGHPQEQGGQGSRQGELEMLMLPLKPYYLQPPW